MSDDIVTRLRHWANAPLKSQMIETTLAEAADEIERLRAELDKRFDRQAVDNIVGSVNDVLHSAIRIREIQSIQDELIKQANNDIERLQAENARLASFLHPIGMVTHEAVHGD